MPGVVEAASNMEKRNGKTRKKSRTKRMAAVVPDSMTEVDELFTLDKAYAKFLLAKSNGGNPPSKVEAVVRDAVASATQFLDAEPSSSSLAVSQQTAVLCSEKATGLWCQESCITEDGSDRDNSGESSQSPLLPRGASGNDIFLQSEVAREKTKRKRVEEDDGSCEAGEERLLQMKARKLSEEARVWQYVCKRSVFVSPPQPQPKLYSTKVTQFGQNNVFTKKTTVLEVHVNDATVKVTLTKESIVAQEWIGQQTGKCFGVDMEWKPNKRRGQPDNKVALLQISSETECLLVQMLFLDSVPSALVQFLKDPERKFAGVGIHGDTKKLRRDHGLDCEGEVELTTLAAVQLKNQELRNVGLKALAKLVLGYDMAKNKSVTMSNWSKSNLDRRQAEYACIDAWVSHAICVRLQESPALTT